ncbi:TraR/DksA family transcriptional regulator [bacterium]|nr:TraR/DksA family transcriptional regulator [bacterium]
MLVRKDELENELAELASEKISTDQVLDPGDQASTSSLEALRSSLQNNEFEEYTRIIGALEMIENGTYGICLECDVAIAEKRLHAYPNASRCVACQEAYEEKQEM